MKRISFFTFTALLLAPLAGLLGAETATSHPSLAPLTPWRAPVWDDYVRNGPTGQNLPDFSKAGYHSSKNPISNHSVTNVSVADSGAIPDDGKDDVAAIQAAIHAVEKKGGGIVYFPPGVYDLNFTPFSSDLSFDRKQYGLVVTRSGVVLRGAGSGPMGTVLRQHNTLLMTPSGGGEGMALVRFMGSGKTGKRVPITADVKRGECLLTVENSALFKAGQIVKLTLVDPAVDAAKPSPEKADLTRALVEPFILHDALVDYLRTGARGGIMALLEIEAIVSPTRIRLTQPLRIDLFTRWQPTLCTFETLSEVGIEGIRFESDWKGGYSHHKPFPIDATGGDYVKGGPGILRSAQEQNYAWSALSFSYVSDGWGRDLSTYNYTQDIGLNQCKFMTFEHIQITGQKGHTGITVSRSFDNLIRDVTITAPRVHTFFVAGFSSGNVFIRSKFLYGPFDKESGCDTCLDFHGYAPYENLYDTIENAYVYPGGALGYLPHAGVRNVFWNIIAPPQMLRGGNNGEFFRTYALTSSRKPLSAHEHWPKSFLIGVHRKGSKITVNGQDADRADEWLTIQGLNRPGVVPESLYEAQVSSNKKQESKSLK
ncbi:MAG: glycosyl hydrolase family 28-related protein [bacterium]